MRISPEEFERRMAHLKQRLNTTGDKMEGDNAMFHMAADALMMEVLERLGYGKGVRIFQSVLRHYE